MKTKTCTLRKQIQFKERLIGLIDKMLESKEQFVSPESLLARRELLVAERDQLQILLSLEERGVQPPKKYLM